MVEFCVPLDHQLPVMMQATMSSSQILNPDVAAGTHYVPAAETNPKWLLCNKNTRLPPGLISWRVSERTHFFKTYILAVTSS